MTRAEALIHELASRHDNADPRFLAAVRPMVDRILDDATPAAARVPLLELLAETFERDVAMRRDLTMAREHWVALMQRLRELLDS
ncbi:MAG: hypothetical protein AB7O97_13620 [Planctomycetota bacterium]